MLGGDVGADHHDRQARATRGRLLAADGADGFQPVHHRHLQVHQGDVVVGPPHGLDRQLAVLDALRLGAHGGQHQLGDLAVGGIVLGDQHLEPRRPRLVQERGLRLGLGRPPGQVDGEGRAAAGTRSCAHGPAHQLDHLAADRQAQAHAAEPAGERSVPLLEALEQALGVVRIEAHAGVGDLDQLAARLARAGQRQPHRHAALGGELHRIAQQLREHLCELFGVGEHRRLGRRIGLDLQRQALGLSRRPIATGHRLRHLAEAAGRRA